MSLMVKEVELPGEKFDCMSDEVALFTYFLAESFLFSAGVNTPKKSNYVYILRDCEIPLFVGLSCNRLDSTLVVHASFTHKFNRNHISLGCTDFNSIFAFNSLKKYFNRIMGELCEY